MSKFCHTLNQQKRSYHIKVFQVTYGERDGGRASKGCEEKHEFNPIANLTLPACMDPIWQFFAISNELLVAIFQLRQYATSQ